MAPPKNPPRRAGGHGHDGCDREMRPLKALLSLEEALAALIGAARPLAATERVPLQEAGGRVLALDLVAPGDVPPFRRAAMDGYAVRARETFGASTQRPKKLRKVDEVHAGEAARVPVGPGECVQIATGAPMPEGADAVVMVEDTEAEGEAVSVYSALHPGANVSPAGEDIRKGTRVLAAGTLLDPSRVGVLAALGVAEAEVYRKPAVAILPSGNEVVPPGRALGAGEIHDVNTYTLSTLVAAHGGVAKVFPPVPDDSRSIREALSWALKGSDLVVATGGSSVGARDLMVEVLGSMGRILFHGIAVKPGKPTLAAVVEGKIALGMPGYPTSCLTNGYGMLVPLLRNIGRYPPWEPRVVRLPLARRVVSPVGRFQFLPVKVAGGKAVPVYKESGAITSMSEADGYVEIAANVDLVDRGEEVEVKLFG
ncbi:MAG: molybdopterin-binding protein [Halobacteria archaeon]